MLLSPFGVWVNSLNCCNLVVLGVEVDHILFKRVRFETVTVLCAAPRGSSCAVCIRPDRGRASRHFLMATCPACLVNNNAIGNT